MSEVTIHPTGTKTPEDVGRENEDALTARILSLRKEWREEWDGEQDAKLAQLGKVDRSRVAEVRGETPETPQHRGVLRVNVATEPLYRGFTEEERQWRNPEADYHAAQYIRGMTDPKSFPGQLDLGRAKLDGIYGRADTLEGAAGADGAISAGTGGALIPRPVEAAIMIARDKVSKMRRFANIFNMTRQTHTVPTVGAFTAGEAAEATTPAQGEGTIAEVQLSAKKWQVKAVASREILADLPINLVSIFTMKAGSALGAYEDAQFWRLGDGSAPSASAFAAGTAYDESTLGTANLLSFLNVSNMYELVGQQYRQNAAWYAASDVLGFLTRVTDAVNGRPFYQGLMDGPAPIGDDAGAEGTLMRRPIFEVDCTAGTIHFGDMSALYLLGSRSGIEARASEDFLFDTDRVMWLWTTRADGINADTVAVQSCTGITSASAAAA